jgi:hypothetical protein
MELRAFHMLSKGCTAEPHVQVLFYVLLKFYLVFLPAFISLGVIYPKLISLVILSKSL